MSLHYNVHRVSARYILRMIASVACEVESEPPTSTVDSRAESAPSTARRIAAGTSGGTCSHGEVRVRVRVKVRVGLGSEVRVGG